MFEILESLRTFSSNCIFSESAIRNYVIIYNNHLNNRKLKAFNKFD
eukprot:UN07601